MDTLLHPIFCLDLRLLLDVTRVYAISYTLHFHIALLDCVAFCVLLLPYVTPLSDPFVFLFDENNVELRKWY